MPAISPDQIADALVWAMCFIFSVTVHEAAHAWVAWRGGDDTAYLGGQVSLNPIPHIVREPVGMLLVPIVSFFMAGWMFGWASTPFDPHWASRHPRRAALMSLAGPVANLLLALAAALLIRLLIAQPYFDLNTLVGDTVMMGLRVLVLLNFILFVFNLIPLAPLDGGTAVVLLFPDRLTNRVLEATHYLGIFGIFIAWTVMGRLMGSLPFKIVLGMLLSQ